MGREAPARPASLPSHRRESAARAFRDLWPDEKARRADVPKYGLSAVCLRPGGIQPEDAPFERKRGLLFSGIEVRDVARAHVLALDADASTQHETLVIGSNNPRCGTPPTQFFADPLGCLDELFPGIRRLVEDRQINVGDRAEWCSFEKAKRLIDIGLSITLNCLNHEVNGA